MKGSASHSRNSMTKIFVIGLLFILVLVAILAGMSKCSGSSSSVVAAGYSASSTTIPKSPKCKVNLHYGDSVRTVYVDRGESVILESNPSFEGSYFAGWSDEEKEEFSRSDINYPSSEPLLVSAAEVDLYPVFLDEFVIINQSADIVHLYILNGEYAYYEGGREALTDDYYIMPGESYSFRDPFPYFYFYVGNAGAFRIVYDNTGSGSVSGLLGFGLKTVMVNGVLIIPEDYLIDPYGMLSHMHDLD